ncbi:hypothetical protein NW754_004797 [Fusarium falciforme]|uniref:Uncharacterized protein n=1 Tax=Fusarium falciforme TaxID=195108 RepID=A0A9W8UU00_9HYPO|nr:hypothetical protein NW754_004797 [Fusarium falciforme]KAJ4178242.1 hypothetical protein NW755_013343 [Fusarium falciforme]
MVERFTLAKSFWLRRDRGFSVKAMWNLMMAAYLFKSDRDLFYYSNLLVTKKNSSLVRYASKTSCWVTGLKLCLAIEELRNRGMLSMGICRYCFDKVEASDLGFADKHANCTFPLHK